jgi:hypothetical protein
MKQNKLDILINLNEGRSFKYDTRRWIGGSRGKPSLNDADVSSLFLSHLITNEGNLVVLTDFGKIFVKNQMKMPDNKEKKSMVRHIPKPLTPKEASQILEDNKNQTEHTAAIKGEE